MHHQNSNKMIRLKLIIFSLIISIFTFAQTPAEANQLFETGNYEEALAAYELLLQQKPKDALYNYQAGLSAYHIGNSQKALTYLEKAGKNYPIRNYYLGKIHLENYHFQQSIEAYEALINSLEPTDSLFQETNRRLAQAKLGANFINRIEDVEIVDSVVVDKKNFISKMPISPDLGTVKQNRQNLGEHGIIDNVQYTTQRGDRTYLSEYLNENSDLFTAIKLLDSWTEKQPISDLNSDANENYPFLLADGITLYFASDGENSMGGYDIFITRLNTSDNTFFRPENLGMPFNSPFNDYMMVVDELKNVGWFASDRFLPEGKVAIYQFIPNKEKKIIRTNDMDSLINRAQITEFTLNATALNTPIPKNPQETGQKELIFINNTLIYSSDADFKSNEARNHYFQMMKLVEEKQTTENELCLLRKQYLNNLGEQKQAIGQKILQLEKRLRELPAQIKSHEKLMRNKEINVL